MDWRVRNTRILILTDQPRRFQQLADQLRLLSGPALQLAWGSCRKKQLWLRIQGQIVQAQPPSVVLRRRADLAVVIPPLDQMSWWLKALHHRRITVIRCLPPLATLSAPVCSGSPHQLLLSPEAAILFFALEGLAARDLDRLEVTLPGTCAKKLSDGLFQQLENRFAPCEIAFDDGIVFTSDPLIIMRLKLTLRKGWDRDQLTAALQRADHALVIDSHPLSRDCREGKKETRVLIDQIQSGNNEKEWMLRLTSDRERCGWISAAAQQICAWLSAH